MKILITGASGFLGSTLYHHFKSSGHETVGTYFKKPAEELIHLDTTRAYDVQSLIGKLNPDLIIHAAGLKNVDHVQKHPIEGADTNIIGAYTIVESIKDTMIRMVEVSSAYVFSTRKNPWRETDVANPINNYGMYKLLAEGFVEKTYRPIIIRPELLWGPPHPGVTRSFVQNVLEGGNMRREQLRQPLWAEDMARGIEIILEKGESGIFHFAGPEKTTNYDLAKRIATEVYGLEKGHVKPTGNETDSFRPSVLLDTSKATNLGIKFTSIGEGLRMMREQLKTVEGAGLNYSERRI